jgi:hypothetical protein
MVVSRICSKKKKGNYRKPFLLASVDAMMKIVKSMEMIYAVILVSVFAGKVWETANESQLKLSNDSTIINIL